MNTPQDDTWLEELLTAETPYIDDAGFSQKVVARLPEKSRVRWQRRLIFLPAFFLSAGVIFQQSPFLLTFWQGWRILPFSITVSQSLLFGSLAATGVTFLLTSLVWISQEN